MKYCFKIYISLHFLILLLWLSHSKMTWIIVTSKKYWNAINAIHLPASSIKLCCAVCIKIKLESLEPISYCFSATDCCFIIIALFPKTFSRLLCQDKTESWKLWLEVPSSCWWLFRLLDFWVLTSTASAPFVKSLSYWLLCCPIIKDKRTTNSCFYLFGKRCLASSS